MATYRVHPRDVDGNIMAPTMTFEATNDLIAIAQALQRAGGCDLEIWDQAQRVGIIQRRGLEESSAGLAEPFATARTRAAKASH
jgi:hypothetical protein